jgi:hypothetical protein
MLDYRAQKDERPAGRAAFVASQECAATANLYQGVASEAEARGMESTLARSCSGANLGLAAEGTG